MAKVPEEGVCVNYDNTVIIIRRQAIVMLILRKFTNYVNRWWWGMDWVGCRN